jgi:hypothetical protein
MTLSQCNHSILWRVGNVSIHRNRLSRDNPAWLLNTLSTAFIVKVKLSELLRPLVQTITNRATHD